MSCNPNKPNKRYGRENLPAEEGGSYRASLCVPACQLAMPPAAANPSPISHTHTHINMPNVGITATSWHLTWHLTWPKGKWRRREDELFDGGSAIFEMIFSDKV
ncbi:hypothetical protein CHARACLAT_007811 [Characodon lateralis]|uniref:Uncharacterized protein n=1 Tax=Characodon lateralis TaxID=208331 RepID=A0ABU7D5M8_9TELE|nr:hypothetical protein [Characodon lateralis]